MKARKAGLSLVFLAASVIVSAIANIWIESYFLSWLIEWLTIVLNFGSAWYLLVIYLKVFKPNCEEMRKNWSKHILAYKNLRTMREDFEWKHPHDVLDLPRPRNYAASYYKSRWVYYLGITFNAGMGVFNVWTDFL